MTKNTAERDASLRAAYLGVVASGVLLVSGSFAALGARTSLAVALGALLAAANLWALERLVHVYLQSERGRWAAVALFKAAALFVLIAVLVKSHVVNVLPLVLGFGALPLGVVIGSVWPQPAVREEG